MVAIDRLHDLKCIATDVKKPINIELEQKNIDVVF